MFEWFWKIVGKWARSERGFAYLQKRANKNHYLHIVNRGKLYMWRGWIVKRRLNLPCVRLHHIMKPDEARSLHSHPFNFRTIILRGWYIQEVPLRYWPKQKNDVRTFKMLPGMQASCYYNEGGQTSNLHRITQVSKGGCWTLFIMWGGKRDDWGFMTKQGYVNYKDYSELGEYV